MWTADMLYEQKFGDIVPNLQVGYINQKDTRGNANRKPANFMHKDNSSLTKWWALESQPLQ
jgi:hypothetical protein